ncbi:EAL domain-containing protein [Acidovorax sp. YS12]|nr:EAL domain-containing protein [Acidovorax sp. YS12]
MGATASSAFRSWIPGIVVALVGLALTHALVQQQRSASEAIASVRFTEEVRSSANAIEQRIVAYTEIVSGMRDLFLVNPGLGYRDFERVAAERAIRQRYPEIRNLNFSRWVPTQGLPAFAQRLRAQGRTGERAQQEILHRLTDGPDHYVIEYLWPWEGNERIWGLDIGSQPANLAAVVAGRATGQATVSAPFELLQEKEQRLGFILRQPLFAADAGAGFVGSVGVSVRVSAMLDAIASAGFFNGVALRLEDVGSVAGSAAPALALLGQFGAWPEASAARELRVLQVHDRRWRLTFVPTRSMLSGVERQLPWWMGSAGVALTLLLAVLASLLVRQRALALGEAQSSNEALEQSEQRFRAVFNQAAVGVSLTRVDTGQILRVNQRYCDIIGYSAEELLQRDVHSLSHPDDHAANLAQLARLKAGDITAFHMEKRLLRKGGDTVWVDLTVSPIWRPGEAPVYNVSVIQDITGRRRMQDQLRESERNLRNILDHLPVGVLLVQGGERIVFRNRSFVQITGYTEQDVGGTQRWWERAYPDAQMRERTRRHWDALCDTARQGDGCIRAGEYDITCRDGQCRTVDISGVLLGPDHLVFFEDLSERKAAEEEATYLAYYDPLTGLPNRRMLLDQVRQAMATSAQSGRSGALLMLDLDHFKTINETRGHDWGDMLLRQVAERLRACTHEEHTVARHGDDEFVVVLESLADNAADAAVQAQEVAQRIQAALRAPYMLGGEPWHASVSMGAAIFRGLGESVDDLLKRADVAMYQAKAAGRDTLQFYDPRIQAVVHARAALELDMRAGLEQGQFELFYQAQMDRGRITGCECLLRWRHPRDGFVSPAAFVPLAEETGLILPLGEWVLQAACRQLAAWARQPALAHLTLAVNVSPRQFHQAAFVSQVLAALAGSGADARHLKLELTEGLLLQDVEDTIAKMAQLKGYGVGFSLDDFGTGYSSLSYLKRLPLDQLKIDQGFVRDVLTDPNDATIARTIVALGTSLGLHVIAEGVETEAQREFLARSDCHAWQGYLLSRPVPVAEFEALVLRQQAGGRNS